MKKLEFNVLHGRVPEYTTSDVKVVALIDGKNNTIPKKGENYAFESVTCNNGASARWNNDEWSITVLNLSENKTVCTLSFREANFFTNYIKSLAESSEELAYDNTADNNLRYIGANPKNYVKFNNELWRIIGVMNNITDSKGNKESHIKIIRNKSIGTYYMNGSGNSDNSGQWVSSSLNTSVLNGTYYNNLTSEAKNMISSVVWYLGVGISSTASANYSIERSSTTWTGRIGLIYASDYGYAVGGSAQNWLSKNQWIINIHPTLNTAYQIDSTGSLYHDTMNHTNAVYPTLYLNSNVEIIADETHNGSANYPYELSIQ